VWLGDARGHATRFSSGRKIAEKVRAPKRENVKNTGRARRDEQIIDIREEKKLQ